MRKKHTVTGKLKDCISKRKKLVLYWAFTLKILPVINLHLFVKFMCMRFLPIKVYNYLKENSPYI